jgi:hypothetical protein
MAGKPTGWDWVTKVSGCTSAAIHDIRADIEQTIQDLSPGLTDRERTARRSFLQSSFGNNGNFELYVPEDKVIRHYYRDNDDPQFAWHVAGDTIAYPCPPLSKCATPRSMTLIQSNFLGDGVHGNFEAIVRVAPPIATQPDYLDFWYLDITTWRWQGPFPLVADGQPVTGVTGEPVLIQSTFGSKGNFELYVPQGNVVRHYFRDNDSPQLPWHVGGDNFGYFCPPLAKCGTLRSVSLIQTNFLGDGVHGNFEAVVRVSPPFAGDPDYLDFWYLDSKTFKWSGPYPLLAGGQPVTGVTGDPVFIQSTFGNRGNFAVYVPQGDAIKHYYRDNDDPQLGWHLAADSLSYFCPPQMLCSKPRGLTFIQSSLLGDGAHGNFEAIVRVSPPFAGEPDHLDSWYFNSRTNKWYSLSTLVPDGKTIDVLTGF